MDSSLLPQITALLEGADFLTSLEKKQYLAVLPGFSEEQLQILHKYLQQGISAYEQTVAHNGEEMMKDMKVLGAELDGEVKIMQKTIEKEEESAEENSTEALLQTL